MKISDIRNKLFTRTTLTSYGVKCEHFNKELYKNDNEPFNNISAYMITIHILKNGSININAYRHNHLTREQLEEIARISFILKNEVINDESKES